MWLLVPVNIFVMQAFFPKQVAGLITYLEGHISMWLGLSILAISTGIVKIQQKILQSLLSWKLQIYCLSSPSSDYLVSDLDCSLVSLSFKAKTQGTKCLDMKGRHFGRAGHTARPISEPKMCTTTIGNSSKPLSLWMLSLEIAPYLCCFLRQSL